jgi:hypothetical protein
MSGPINPLRLPANETITEVVAQAGVSPTPSGQPATAPSFPAGPEPSRVFGYLAFVDPTTGSEFIPHSTDNPLETIGAPGPITFRFMNPAGNTIDLLIGHGYREVVRNADGTFGYWTGTQVVVSLAWYYDINMNPDRSEGYPREEYPAEFVRSSHATGVISYNPDQWRFVDIVGSAHYPTLPIPGVAEHILNRRASPFPDLPDTA